MLEPPLAEMSAESNQDLVEASDLPSTQVRLCVRNGLSGEELALEKSVWDMRTTTLKDVREAIASAIRAARPKKCSKANESGGLEGSRAGGEKFRCFWEQIALMSVDDERITAEGEETFLIDQLEGNIAKRDQVENYKDDVEQDLQVENDKSAVEMEQSEQNRAQLEDQDERTRRGHEPEPNDEGEPVAIPDEDEIEGEERREGQDDDERGEERKGKHNGRGAEEGERDEGEYEQAKTQTRLRVVVIEYYFRERWKAFESREELDEALAAYLQFWKDCDCDQIDSDCIDRYRDRWEKHIGPGTKLAKYGPLRIWDLSNI
ncbi:unnamed protein product, partial [Amoebophrya sp. A25]|eukprot:GSA25T00009266001.1